MLILGWDKESLNDEVLKDNLNYIGNELKNYRAANNLSQKELADKLCITKSTVSVIEEGKYCELTLKFLRFLSRKLELNLTIKL